MKSLRWMAAPLLLLWSASGAAFDSAGYVLSGNKTYAQPAYTPSSVSAIPGDDPFAGTFCSPVQFPTPSADTCSTADAVTANQFNFVTKTFHFATANYAGDTTDLGGVPHGFMQCPRTSTAVSVQPPNDLQDLSQCTDVDWAAGGPISTAGWVNVRRAWSAPPAGDWTTYQTPEHMLITQQAASIAGFPTPLASSGSSTNPLFTKVFWMQYPVTDQYLASPITQNNQNYYVVGQSFRPVSFANVGAHASRGLYLAELAQMPDLSFSVWDWAAGNEGCPIQGLDSPNGLNAFSSAGSSLYDVNNCHDFGKMLGPLNVSHFKPGSRAYYVWYHQLALSRMTECSNLATTVSPLDQGNVSGIDRNATFGTEAHDCEREAMVYEMFAQHFLQDNWSTGHMWDAWGSPDLADMPTTLPLAQWAQVFALSNGFAPSPLTWTFPNENLAARRVVMATVLGALRGTIHGTKAVSAGISLPPGINGVLPDGGVADGGVLGQIPFLTDDPLCGPHYPDIAGAVQSGSGWTLPDALTSWSLQGGTLAIPLGPNGVSPGAGDYYWSPDPSFGKASILADDVNRDYQAQRDHLLACTAKSLRDVYLAGPQVHGALNPSTPVDGLAIDGVDPAGPDCWNNWATNDSMEGALAPLFYSRNWPGRPGNPLLQQALQSLTPLFNIVISSLAVNQKFGVAPEQNQYDQTWLKSLGTLLAAQSLLDTIVLEANMVAGALTNPNGTDVAQMSSQKLTMLNVPSWTPPPSGPPIYYADVATPRGSEADFPGDYVVRRMFWRSHLREMCAEVDPTTLTTLRNRCINAGGAGGDPEACTACVESAEPQIPTCQPVTIAGFDFVGHLGQSKCSALTGTTQPGLPLEWSMTDFAENDACPSCTGPANSRWQLVGGIGPNCIPPQLAAIEFCTGTEGTYNPVALPGQTATFNGGPLLGDPNDVVVLNTIQNSQANSACLSQVPDPNLPPPSPFLLNDTMYQVGLVHTEGSAVTPETIVTAYQLHRQEADGQSTGTPGGFTECTMQVTFDSNAPWDDALPPISNVTPPGAANAQTTMSVLPYPGAPFERGLGLCGTTQRFSLWDRTCSDVATKFPGLGIDLSLGSGLQADRALVGSGYEDFAFQGIFGGQEARCAVVEPRSDVASTLTHVCHSPGYACNSGNLCVPSQGLPPNIFYLLSW